MRKALTAVIIILLLCSTIGCAVNAAEEEVRYTPGGRRLIPLEIHDEEPGGGNGRSLSTMVAEAVYNYAEVLIYFVDENMYYDANFRRGVTGIIEVPDGMTINPAGAGGELNAVMFAGYRRTSLDTSDPDSFGADLTLLAIGLCTELEGNAPGNRQVSEDTTGLRFQLRALETSVTIGAGPASRPNSFAVLTPTPHTGQRIILAGGSLAPYFEIPANSGGITARFKVDGFLTAETPAFSGFPNPGSAVYINKPDPEVDTVQFVWGGDPIKLTGYAVLNGGPGPVPGSPPPSTSFLTAATGAGQLTGAGGSFNLMISTVNTEVPAWLDGWALLSLNIPVRIFGRITTHRGRLNDLWYIRSGMYYDQPDRGYDVEFPHSPTNPDAGESHSLGGGVLLKIGSPFLDPSF